MKSVAFLWSIYLCSSTFGQIVSNDDYYTAAVVEYATIFDKSLTPGANIRENVKQYAINIRKAAEQGADIVVFPECGLTGLRLPSKASELQIYTSIIPDPAQGIIPCTSDKWTDVLKQLSCAASQNSIYVVVNLPEKKLIDSKAENVLIFNTNIVFDRHGAIIARYRKYNLFVEPGFNRTDTPDITTFTTDFGVTFGTFICFDILFSKPALELLKLNPNVTDIAYTTAWFSELPFLTAVQTQAGWARSTGVNLLASGFDDPENFGGGSGVYQANGNIRYIVPATKKTTLIVTRVQKIKQRITSDPEFTKTPEVVQVGGEGTHFDEMHAMKEDMHNYTTLLLNETSLKNLELCHDEFCCTFTVQFAAVPNADYYYRLIVYDGPRRMGVERNNVQICGIAACQTTSKFSCGERRDHLENPIIFELISISGTFKDDDNTVVIPSNTHYNLSTLLPSEFSYKVKATKDWKRIELQTVSAVDKILGFGIYGISKNTAANSSSALLSIVLLPIVTLLFISYTKLRLLKA